MTNEERDESIRVLARVCFEAQIWTAALKEILISRGLTTDEEFARYVAAAQRPSEVEGSDPAQMDLLSDFEGPEQ
jgi:hypothetical protein